MKISHEYHEMANVSYQIGVLYTEMTFCLLEVTFTPGLCLQLQIQPKFKRVKKLVWVFSYFSLQDEDRKNVSNKW